MSADCITWTGAVNSSGYGCATNGKGGSQLVHRAAYELAREPIPADLTIDHLCRNKLCVNVDHLEVVTRSENSRRQAAARTHCARGHIFDTENTYLRSNGSRECKTCRYARWADNLGRTPGRVGRPRRESYVDSLPYGLPGVEA